MKIVEVDNFDKETISDFLICENVSKLYGEIITKALNEKLSGDHADKFYRLVEDNYKLYVFEP